jgi:hypothetical protein
MTVVRWLGARYVVACPSHENRLDVKIGPLDQNHATCVVVVVAKKTY